MIGRMYMISEAEEHSEENLGIVVEPRTVEVYFDSSKVTALYEFEEEKGKFLYVKMQDVTFPFLYEELMHVALKEFLKDK